MLFAPVLGEGVGAEAGTMAGAGAGAAAGGEIVAGGGGEVTGALARALRAAISACNEQSCTAR